MAGYIGSKASVTQVDGYNRTEADSEFVQVTGDTMTGNLSVTGTVTADGLTVHGNSLIGPSDTTSEYQGLSLQNGKDSSVSTTVSFIDFRNNLGIPDSHIFGEHRTDGGSSLRFGTTPAGSRSTDRRVERMRIDSSGRVTMPYQPCFSGSASGANMSWSAGSTIIKQVNITYIPVNVGGHFSDSTNRFTAPVAGNYYFSAKATQTGTATGPAMLFYKNGASFGYEASIGYYTAYHSFTGSTIMSLAAGDYVDLRISNYNTVAMTIDGTRTTFSGYLIG